MNIPKISQNNYRNNVNSNSVNFAAKSINVDSKFFKPVKKAFKPAVNAYDSGVDVIAKGIGKILNTDTVIGILSKTKRSKLLMNHLMTFASTVLSGFYVLRTLSNKDLDEKKKKTLAINQSAVFGLSTVMCYTLDGLLNKNVARFTNRFEVVNHSVLKKEVLQKCVKGMPAAKSVAIFDIIYRFIAPVMITPIANHIGNKMHEKKQEELANGKQPLNKNA